ncbi:UPF0575 protein C19orf67 homolog [Puntigrus tetrazona]|uniref:UPF0575 protein C19orf67 homolog n=1 Tax=Puntigrus tetrazona TaxID=1606681 RepID=UPI001C894BA6|nr:UPF0575 protein C19orf67 homolog [Puntigrus tetrazona]
MAKAEHAEWKSLLSEENEASRCLSESETTTHALEDVGAMAPSFGDERYFLVEGAEAQDKRIMDAKISPIERQLEYLLNKADEFQTQLLWSRECLQNYGFAHIVPMFLQTCQPYFTYLESTARNSHPFRPALSTYIRAQLLQFSQQLCSRLEQLVLLYASFSLFSLEESDPLSISHFFIGQCQIDNTKLSIFRYSCPTPFLTSACTGLYKRMRWNVERQIEGEGQTYDSAEFYFLCCEDVIKAADDKDVDGKREEENTETDRESRAQRIWSIGWWIQTYPDPDTEDITDWVLCLVPFGQYKQLLCLGSEEPSSCTATDCLLGVLLSQETDLAQKPEVALS